MFQRHLDGFERHLDGFRSQINVAEAKPGGNWRHPSLMNRINKFSLMLRLKTHRLQAEMAFFNHHSTLTCDEL